MAWRKLASAEVPAANLLGRRPAGLSDARDVLREAGQKPRSIYSEMIFNFQKIRLAAADGDAFV